MEDREHDDGDGSSSSKEEMKSSTTEVNATRKLKHLLWTEKLAPELLPYDNDMVETIQLGITNQIEIIQSLQHCRSEGLGWIIDAHEMDMDRHRFRLTCYFRIRLKKIEKNVIYILKNLSHTLSTAETKFAMGFLDIMEAHCKASFFNQIPLRWTSLIDPPTMIPEPNLCLPVFILVNINFPAFEIGEDEHQDLRKNDIIVGSYKRFRPLVFSDAVRLI